MGLVVDWYRLGAVTLPFLVALCVSATFAVLLRRASWRSGLPHRREPCARCVFEGDLLRYGTCVRDCSVNAVPELPFVLFGLCSTFAIFLLFFPQLAVVYLLPLGASPAADWGILGFLVATTAGSSILIAAYFVQDLAGTRELFTRIAAGGTLAGLVVGLAMSGPVASLALEMSPLGLFVLLIGIALEHRARTGRPVFGLRTIGAAAVPLYLVAGLAAVRLWDLLTLSGVIP